MIGQLVGWLLMYLYCYCWWHWYWIAVLLLLRWLTNCILLLLLVRLRLWWLYCLLLLTWLCCTGLLLLLKRFIVDVMIDDCIGSDDAVDCWIIVIVDWMTCYWCIVVDGEQAWYRQLVLVSLLISIVLVTDCGVETVTLYCFWPGPYVICYWLQRCIELIVIGVGIVGGVVVIV